MTSLELKKKLAEKEKQYMLIRFGFYAPFLVSYDEGMSIIKSLENAEVLTEIYDKPPSLSRLSKKEFSFTFLNQKDYETYKICSLLKITEQEAQKLQEDHATN
jgi:hypothetical protein